MFGETPMNAASVSRSFSYSQAETLVENILRYVREINAKSLLDIGAGRVSVARQLSNSVQRYLAVEYEPERCDKLRQAGLPVVERRFPFPISECFDLVLSSHSVPELALKDYPPFLLSAWDLVRPGGIVLIITFKGSEGDLQCIRTELTGVPRNGSAEFRAIMNTLIPLAPIRIERVNSYARSAIAEDIVSFFGPSMFPVNRVDKSALGKFKHIVETRYKVNQSCYVFPTEHLFISCRKVEKGAY